MTLSIADFLINPNERIIKDINLKSFSSTEAKISFLNTLEKVNKIILILVSISVFSAFLSLAFCSLTYFNFLSLNNAIIPITIYASSFVVSSALGRYIYNKSNDLKDSFKATVSKAEIVKNVFNKISLVYFFITFPFILFKAKEVLFNRVNIYL